MRRYENVYDTCPAGTALADILDALQVMVQDEPKVEPAADRAAVRVQLEGSWYQLQVVLVPDPGLPS